MGHMFSNLVELKFVDPFLWGAPIPIYIWPNAVHFHLLWKRKGIKSFCLPPKKKIFFYSVLEASALSADADDPVHKKIYKGIRGYYTLLFGNQLLFSSIMIKVFMWEKNQSLIPPEEYLDH